MLLLAFVLLVPSLVFGQVTCEHDGHCTSSQTCAFGVGDRFGLAVSDNVCLAPGSLARSAYEVVEFQPITTSEGTFDRFIVSQLNNRGQVVGTALRSEGAPAGEVVAAAFRYTPGLGVELLEAPQGQLTSGQAITEAGDVLGELYSPRTRNSFFRFQQGAYTLLDRGANRALVRTFILVASNDRGDLLGYIVRRDRRIATYFHTEAEGWVNLAARFPSLREHSILPRAINNEGDILVMLIDPGAPLHGFVIQDGTRLVELGDEGSQFLPEAINDEGRVVGSVLMGHSRHAFVQDAGGGMVDLHRARFEFSSATGVTSSGIVVGGLAKGASNLGGSKSLDTLFTFDDRRSQAVKVVARRAEFQPLIPEGRLLGSVEVLHVNDRLEMVGTAHGLTRVEDEDGVQIVFDVLPSSFYFSPAVGVVGLEELLDGAGPQGSIPSVADFNERGEILVEFLERGDDELSFQIVSSALLTPAAP